jgi:tRNA pseudouridine55 synthase
MDGVLIVDKPSGPTSHDVVAVVRRAIGSARVGHLGTLDPLATGVLPLVVGRATRLAQFLSASDKEYVAEIRIGAVSETYDAEGPLTPFGLAPDASVRFDAGFGAEFEGNADALDAWLAEFRGSYLQRPPPHSAKKIGGTPAYELARRKRPVELKPVPVTVHALEALAVEHDLLRVRVVCSAGFYVRTLAHDIGQRLGCGAYLAALRRTRAGSFREAGAVPLAQVVAEGFDGMKHLTPVNRLLPDLPAVVLNEAGVRRVSHGNAVGPEHVVTSHQWAAPFSRLLDAAGGLLAIAEPRPGGLLHPSIVLV